MAMHAAEDHAVRLRQSEGQRPHRVRRGDRHVEGGSEMNGTEKLRAIVCWAALKAMGVLP